MRRAIAEEWVKALRSGDYKQGRFYLKKNDHHCCLGVACEIAVVRGVIDAAIDTTDDVNNADLVGVKEFAGHAQGLPEKVQLWMGMQNGLGARNDTEMELSLAAMNDDGKTFAEIADYIDQNYHVL